MTTIAPTQVADWPWDQADPTDVPAAPSTTLPVLEPFQPLMPAMSIVDALAREQAVIDFRRQCMIPGVDFDDGATFGSEGKPSLLQPGAQKLHWWFGLSVETRVTRAVEDWSGSAHEGEPTFAYWCATIVRDRLGYVIATGLGMCSTRESQHRYRWVPAHELPPNVPVDHFKSRTSELSEFAFAIEARQTTGDYGKPAEWWDMWAEAIRERRAVATERKTGKGKVYDAWKLAVTTYRVPNEQVPDVINSVLKVAAKRSYVDGIIRATGTSALWTQDGEDAARNDAAARGVARASSAGATGDSSAQPTSSTPAPDAAATPRQTTPAPAPTRDVDPSTGEVVERVPVELDSATADALLVPLGPAAWSAAGLTLTKAMQRWTTLGDCDVETLTAFAGIDPKSTEAEDFVRSAARVLNYREQSR